jgi:hypothetical protein
MGNGVKGAGSTSPGATPVGGADVQETKKTETPQQQQTQVEDKQPQKPPPQTGKSEGGVVHDTSAALRKADLHKALGITKPTKAQLEEIRSAMKDGRKEDAIKLTIKYYHIDTSGANEVKYVGSKNESAAGSNYKPIGTGTHKRGDKISIEIGDESFKFNGNESPEWLAGAIAHESFHAKNHFRPDKPVIARESQSPSQAEQAQMTQQELVEEIQAYSHEQNISGKIGMTPEMIQEIQSRQNKVYGELSPENREILRPILRGTQPWPEAGAQQ